MPFGMKLALISTKPDVPASEWRMASCSATVETPEMFSITDFQLLPPEPSDSPKLIRKDSHTLTIRGADAITETEPLFGAEIGTLVIFELSGKHVYPTCWEHALARILFLGFRPTESPKETVDFVFRIATRVFSSRHVHNVVQESGNKSESPQ
jgi:hypothetical protein